MVGLTFIIGKKGSGKSLLAIILAYYFQKFIDVILNFPNSLEKSKKFEIAEFLADNYSNCVLFFDEAYLLLDAHKSSSHLNQELSHQLYQVRHTDIDIFLITPLKMIIEKRYRLQEDNYIECYRIPDNLSITPEYFYYEFHIDNEEYDWFLPFENAKPFFKFYNTKERLNKENMTDAKLRIIKETNPKLFVEMSAKVAKQIFNRHKNEEITHDLIILDLQKLNESQLYEKNCYIMCKDWNNHKGVKKRNESK